MRSNRPLTQFAISKLREYLSTESRLFTPAQEGNTAVSLTKDCDFDVLTFWLHEERILEVIFDGVAFCGLNVYDGNFYDRAGNPSTTTCERLNGLLDALGDLCLIPEGVRVFKSKDDGHAYIGRGSRRARFGKGQKPVSIEPNALSLEFSHA